MATHHSFHHHHHPRHQAQRIAVNTTLGALAAGAASPSAALSWQSRLAASMETERLELLLLLVASMICVTAWLAMGRSRDDLDVPQPGSPSGCAGPTLRLVGAARPTPSDWATYRRLRNRYMLAYSLASFGDWIQGGYLYALYAGHGYSMEHIAYLFVVGYGSAATLGTYSSAVGTMADS